MATTGVLNGTDLLVYVDGTAIAYAEDCTVSMNVDMMDISSKDSHGHRDVKPGERSFTMSTNGLVALDATYGIEELWGLYNSRSSVTLKCGTDDSADRLFTGTGYLSSLEVTAPKEQPSTFTANFEGSGKLDYTIT